MKKKALEFNFAWLFAILVGAVIIFLAIYISAKIVDTGTSQTSTITAKQLSILFKPLEVGLASGKSSIITLKEISRINNKCLTTGSFGKHLVSISNKKSKKEWSKGVDISVPNKYIFSSSIEEGKKVYFFSKPFKTPWKVSDIIFMTTKQYCFVNPPDFVRKEVQELQIQNINLNSTCTSGIRVCFPSGTNCSIKVYGTCSNCENKFEEGYVEKANEKLYYSNELIYAAIFSDKDIYECNIKRLMKRAIKQALIFKEEGDFLGEKCNINPVLFIRFITLASSINNSASFLSINIKQTITELEEQNDASECKFW